MNISETRAREKRINRWITITSIAVPLVIIMLFGIRIPNVEPLWYLPPTYAFINGLTAVLLITAVSAIRMGNRVTHQRIMVTCMILSMAFLVMYVAYHMTSDTTTYGGQDRYRILYYIVLISHIILSVAIVPLVLKTYALAYLKKFEQHRRLARITFPVWLYVTVSGVLIYFMISPYYQH